MKIIKEYIEQLNDELCGARDYAERYVEYKSKADGTWANRFKEMANDELKHAMYIHDWLVKEIESISKVYTPPEEMLEKWEKAHKVYVEKMAWIKQMLAL